MTTKLKEKKHTNNVAVDKTEEMKTELKSITKQHGEHIQSRNYHDEMAKRCLGAMEVLQKFVGEETEDV
jgi:hypothetical protein